jgi:ABC-2 type transport system permease protein
MSVIVDKQFGFMKEILVAPVSRTSIALGKILGSGTVSLLTAFMILVIAVLIGGISLSSLSLLSLAIVVAFMILTAFVFVSIGLIIASRMKDTEGFSLIMNFLVMPVFLLSGAFFPATGVPSWMKVLVYANPLFYSVDGMRGALIGSSSVPIPVDLGIMFVLSVVLIILASYMFSKMEK